MYRHLQVDLILQTADALGARIEERFPRSGLSRVASELIALARDGKSRLARLGRPMWGIRLTSGAAVVFLLAVLVSVAVMVVRVPQHDLGSRADVLQAMQAMLDEIVLVGIAVLFLAGLEARAKRADALRTLHQYRSIAHVIDMHQLTKDPERLGYPRGGSTASSPKRDMTAFKLGRYLDYCSELLSIVSKMAALHVQDLSDPVVLGAVRDVESLTGSLQAKIWQKKLILDVTRLALAKRGPGVAPVLEAVREAEGLARAAGEPGAPVGPTQRGPVGSVSDRAPTER